MTHHSWAVLCLSVLLLLFAGCSKGSGAPRALAFAHRLEGQTLRATATIMVFNRDGNSRTSILESTLRYDVHGASVSVEWTEDDAGKSVTLPIVSENTAENDDYTLTATDRRVNLWRTERQPGFALVVNVEYAE